MHCARTTHLLSGERDAQDIRQRDRRHRDEHAAIGALAEHEREHDERQQAGVAHPALPQQGVPHERLAVAVQRLLELRG